MKVTITDNSSQILAEIKARGQMALTAAGMIVERHAKAKCPVDTGNLRNSIHYNATEHEVTIGTSVEYAPYVELGTSRKGARPYLRPAVEDNIDEIFNKISSVIKTGR